MSTNPITSDPEARFLRFAVGYRDRPDDMVKALKVLWEKNKGLPIQDGGDLALGLHLLSVIFRATAGRNPPPDELLGLLPKPEGRLWRACVAQELPILLLDMMQEENFVEQPYEWVFSVIVLNAGFARALQHHVPQGDRLQWPGLPKLQEKKYAAAIGPAIDALWRDRRALLSQDDGSKFGRNLVHSIVFFVNVATAFMVHTRPEYEGEYAKISSQVGVMYAAFLCFATSSHPAAHVAPNMFCAPFQIVRQYHGIAYNLTASNAGRHKAANTWRSYIEPVLDDLGGLKFMRACHTALTSWPSVVGIDLAALLAALDQLVTFYDETGVLVTDEWAWSLTSRRSYLEIPFLNAIAVGLEREIRQTASYTAENIKESMAEYTNMCIISCRLLHFHVLAFIDRANNPPVTDGRSIYVILSKCFALLVAFMQNEHQWPTLKAEGALDKARRDFDDACVEWSELGDRNWRTELQIITLRRVLAGITAAAEGAWYADMHALRSLRGKYSGSPHYEGLVQSWTKFGKAFGLAETTERDKHDAANRHMCSWAGCPYYTQPSTAQLSNCAGCGERRYCSRDCQKKDWKQGGHREKCRRINK